MSHKTTFGNGTDFAAFDEDEQLTMHGSGKVTFETRLDIDVTTQIAQAKPTIVYRGIVRGFSLPVYNTDNEELFAGQDVPFRWDGVSNPTVHVHCYCPSANTAKKFQLRASWEHYGVDNGAVPDTSNDVDIETITGTDAVNHPYEISIPIDYDIDGVGNELCAGDAISLRIHRIAASADEIAGEVVITHVGIVWIRNKLGAAVV